MNDKVKKLATLQKEPNLALFDELTELNERFEAIQAVLSEINLKEAKTYEEELNGLQEAILSLRVDEVVSLTELQSRKEKLENQLQIINDKIKAIESLKK